MSRYYSKNTLSAALASGALFAGAAPAMANSTNRTHRAPKHNLAHAVQRDMNQLARRAYTDKKLGGAALSIVRQNHQEVVTLKESAPTRTGSDKGGEYVIFFKAGIARDSGPNLNRVHKLAIAEGTLLRDGHLTDGTLLKAKTMPSNARIAEVNAPFNVPRLLTSEAAVHPRPHEARLRPDWLIRWDKLANRLITGAEHHTPTGPHLPQLWHEPPGDRAQPFQI